MTENPTSPVAGRQDGQGINEDLAAQLTSFGLTSREAQLYVTVLALAEPTVAEVAQMLGLNRTGAYDAMTGLAQKDLIQFVDSDRVSHRAGTKVLRAADPGILLARHRRGQVALEQLVPHLRGVSVHNEPHAQYFQGIQSMQTALMDILNWDCELRGIISMNDLHETVGVAAMDAFIAERARLGMELRVVRSRARDVPGRWPSSDEDRRELRWAPSDYVFTSTMYIGARDVLLISSPADTFALKISSKEFAVAQRHLFELLWARSDPT